MRFSGLPLFFPLHYPFSFSSITWTSPTSLNQNLFGFRLLHLRGGTIVGHLGSWATSEAQMLPLVAEWNPTARLHVKLNWMPGEMKNKSGDHGTGGLKGEMMTLLRNLETGYCWNNVWHLQLQKRQTTRVLGCHIVKSSGQELIDHFIFHLQPARTIPREGLYSWQSKGPRQCHAPQEIRPQ